LPAAPFFRSLGLFVVEDFLSQDECLRLRTEMKAVALEKGKLYNSTGGAGAAVDENFRQAYDAIVADDTISAMRQRIRGIRPALADHFHVSLSDECHGPDFVTYLPGGFFSPHRDVDERASEEIQRRRVSMVIFLNSQSSEPAADCFGGGGLTFYGLMDGPEWEKCGFTIMPKTGLLVAFRPGVLHGVHPVTFGERHIIVCAFLAGTEPALESSKRGAKIGLA
jgi:predicted 2-oxoglutarate/Fe(II)-dependent dioxygenase YbiX